MSPKTAVMAAVAASLLVLVGGCAPGALPATQPALGVGTASATPAPPATCPASVAHLVYPAASRATIVSGTPDQATVCRYAGLNAPPPHALVRSATMGATQAAALARDLDRAKPFPVGVAYNCGIDLGQAVLPDLGLPPGHGAGRPLTHGQPGAWAVANGGSGPGWCNTRKPSSANTTR